MPHEHVDEPIRGVLVERSHRRAQRQPGCHELVDLIPAQFDPEDVFRCELVGTQVESSHIDERAVEIEQDRSRSVAALHRE